MRRKNIVLEISQFYYCDAHHVTFTFLIKCCFLIYWPIFESTIATLQLSQHTLLKEITRDICHFFSTDKNVSSGFLQNMQHFSTKIKNIARGTTDPEIDSVTWIKFINNMAPLALIANLATRWRHLTFSHLITFSQ